VRRRRVAERGQSSVDTGSGLNPAERCVLQALDDVPIAFETILLRTELSIAAAAEACDRLVQVGRVETGPGWWCKK
jgi:hypothetical protein